jgi:hypothetical protein
LHGQARRTARLGISKQVGIDSALRRIERIAYAIAILIMAITVLMEVKPF